MRVYIKFFVYYYMCIVFFFSFGTDCKFPILPDYRAIHCSRTFPYGFLFLRGAPHVTADIRRVCETPKSGARNPLPPTSFVGIFRVRKQLAAFLVGGARVRRDKAQENSIILLRRGDSEKQRVPQPQAPSAFFFFFFGENIIR